MVLIKMSTLIRSLKSLMFKMFKYLMQCRLVKAESLIINSVGHRPTKDKRNACQAESLKSI